MLQRLPLFCLLLSLTLASAAAAAKIQTESVPKGELAALRSYAWQKESAPGSDPVDRLIREAADDTLAKKGLVRVEAGEEPDLLISYQVGAADQLRSSMLMTVGWWGGLVAYPGARSAVEAVLLIVLTDSTGERPLWAGSILVRGNTPQAEMVMQERAGKYAAKVLKKYPKLPSR